MATAEELIAQNIAYSQQFISEADAAIAEIVLDKGAVGYSLLDIGDGGFTSQYVPPNPDNTPFPVYQPPNQVLPTSPTLVALSNINSPTIPVTPTVNTSGLFTKPAPNSNLPDFNETAPDLAVDDILAQLKAVAKPVLQHIDLPTLTPLVLRTAPTVQLPDYEAYPTPQAIPAPVDYAARFQVEYSNAKPGIKAFVEDAMEQWRFKYAPEYNDLRAKLEAKVMDGMDGGILPDQFEAALFSRSQARTAKEFDRAEASLLSDPARRGFIVPPGAIVSGLSNIRTDAATALAGSSTEVYLERRRSEVQFVQAMLGLADGWTNNIRGQVMQYAQNMLQVHQQAVQLATEINRQLQILFEHERSRHEFSLAIMKALNEQFEVKLKAALSGLEAYKLELEAAKLRTDIDMAQIEATKLQLDAQKVEVQLYSEIIDAIAKQAVIDELKIKEYGIRANVFEINTKARVAAFDMYKAYIDGDKAKLEGELAKVSIYETQLRAETLKISAQTAVLDANVKTNDGKLNQYTKQLDAYKTNADIALQRFTAEAELKKLGLGLYETNVKTSLDVFKAAYSKELAFLEARIQAFKANTGSLSDFYQLEKGYAELSLHALTSVAKAYGEMGSATLQATNAVLSVAQ
jgi:hypothetical protein